MKPSNIINATLGSLALFICATASATHIDQLGINISLNSSDGAGNFSLKYDEYFGSDSTSGVGPFNPSGPLFWDATDSSSISISESIQSATITGSSSFTTSFMGIVNSLGTNAGTFGPGQNMTQFVNDNSDAGLYSAIINFSIASFDSTLSYLVNTSANDCCFVSGSGGPSFNGSFNFDPSIVVQPPVNAVPLPAAAFMFAPALLGFMGLRRKAKKTVV